MILCHKGGEGSKYTVPDFFLSPQIMLNMAVNVENSSTPSFQCFTLKITKIPLASGVIINKILSKTFPTMLLV